MTKVNCLNPISELGTGLFNNNYEMTAIFLHKRDFMP